MDGERGRRREEILAVALEVLAERGYRGASMLEVAGRARASKETLYAWFGDKSGLFGELISWQAARIDETLSKSLERDGEDPEVVLESFARELLLLLLGERAVIINRAAISEAASSPELARVLSERGRSSVVPKLARYLEEQRDAGRFAFESAGAAVETLIGLAISDRQVRRLLGVLPEPGPEDVRERARNAVESFMKLYSVS